MLHPDSVSAIQIGKHQLVSASSRNVLVTRYTKLMNAVAEERLRIVSLCVFDVMENLVLPKSPVGQTYY